MDPTDRRDLLRMGGAIIAFAASAPLGASFGVLAEGVAESDAAAQEIARFTQRRGISQGTAQDIRFKLERGESGFWDADFPSLETRRVKFPSAEGNSLPGEFEKARGIIGAVGERLSQNDPWAIAGAGVGLVVGSFAYVLWDDATELDELALIQSA